MLVRVTQKILLIQKRICFLLGEIKFFKKIFEKFLRNGGFRKSSTGKGLGRIEKTYRYSFCTGLFDFQLQLSINYRLFINFSVKKMKKNSMYWNHKLIKEKMFVQNKLKNALENNKKKWNAKRFVFIIGSRDRQGSADRPIRDFQNFVGHDPGLLKFSRSWSGPVLDF